MGGVDVPDPLDLVENSRRAVLGLRAQGLDAFAIVLGAAGAETVALIFGRSGCATSGRWRICRHDCQIPIFRLSRR